MSLLESALDGDIIAFDDDRQEGIVLGRDGRRYSFTLAEWRGKGLPAPDRPVRFQPHGDAARQVFDLPVRQRRARASRETSDIPRRYAGMAVLAIIVAFISLFFEGRVAPLNIAAAVLAVLGLRQIRRDPLRYQGRIFCWAAIALALVLAILAALVEPTMTTAPGP